MDHVRHRRLDSALIRLRRLKSLFQKLFGEFRQKLLTRKTNPIQSSGVEVKSLIKWPLQQFI
jgi:hypothetical protein